MIRQTRWPWYEHVFFDCDSTLTTVEGIDVLAEAAGKQEEVEALTNAAMDGGIDLKDVYDKRLQAIRPSRKQVEAIRKAYKQNPVEDAQELITTLQENGHKVFIISGGLYDPVLEFGISLGVKAEHIRAVDLNYNQLAGDWWETEQSADNERYLDFDEGALTISDGKALIVKELLAEYGGNGRSLLIGDGSSDLMASRAIDLFVGYGGVVARDRVMTEAPLSIRSASLAPLLPIVMTPGDFQELLTPENRHNQLAQKARHLLQSGDLTFTNEKLYDRFKTAYQTIYTRTR